MPKIKASAVQKVKPRIPEGIYVYVPNFGSFLGGWREDDSWGQHDPPSWIQAGPGWVQGGGDLWKPDEGFLDFGGILTKELAMSLVQMDARIIRGSVGERRWRIAVPKTKVQETKKLLRAGKVDFIKDVKIAHRS